MFCVRVGASASGRSIGGERPVMARIGEKPLERAPLGANPSTASPANWAKRSDTNIASGDVNSFTKRYGKMS